MTTPLSVYPVGQEKRGEEDGAGLQSAWHKVYKEVTVWRTDSVCVFMLLEGCSEC